jgi:hypothetical protein
MLPLEFTPIEIDSVLSLATGVGPGPQELWNQSAFKHFVGDGGCHFVDEHNAHLWIALQKLYCLLFLWRRRLWWCLFLLPQLFAGGARVFRNDLGGDLVQDWVLVLGVRSGLIKSAPVGRALKLTCSYDSTSPFVSPRSENADDLVAELSAMFVGSLHSRRRASGPAVLGVARSLAKRDAIFPRLLTSR